MARTFRVGIIGCGRHMFEFLLHAVKWTGSAQVVTACDIDQAKLDRIAAIYNLPSLYTDVDDMLAHEALDAVIVSVGHDKNTPLIRAALEAGAHVFVEKTPCASTAEARELLAVEERTGKAIMVGFNRRFMTSYVLARDITRREEFGGIRMYHSQFHATPYAGERALKINHIIHHLDLARFLMGEITITHADILRIDDRQQGFNICFRSETGGIGVIQSASMLDESYPMERLELVGQRRNVVVDNVKGLTYNRPPAIRDIYQPMAMNDSADALVWNPSHGFYPRFSHHGYENELRHFFDCLENGTTPEPGIGDSLKTLELVETLDRLTNDGAQAAA